MDVNKLKFYTHVCIGCQTLLKASYKILDGEPLIEFIDYEFHLHGRCANCRRFYTFKEIYKIEQNIQKDIEKGNI